MVLFNIEKTKTHKYITIFGIKIKIKRKKRVSYLTEEHLFTILNTLMDIKDCPKAKGKLRKLQLADTLLLKIFHDICEKHNLNYWLIDGTLLGAIRHNGFIPWDDDLDIAISYDSYDKLVEILKEEFKNTNFIMYGIDKSRFGNATLRISHKNFEKLNLDIFYYHPSKLHISDKEYVENKRNEYRKIYYKKYSKVRKNENYEILKNFRLEIDTPFEKDIQAVPLEESNTLVNQISSNFQFLDTNWVFPVIKHKFEDFEFYIPNNYDKVLSECYGDYFSFPPNIAHHGSLFKEFNEEDIDKIIEELKQYIANKV